MNPDAASQVTANAIKAKSDLLPVLEFTQYIASPIVAAGAFYIPANHTIIHLAVMIAAGAAGDLQLYYGVFSVGKNSFGDDPYSRSLTGAVMCDGVSVKYKNNRAADAVINLLGGTFS